MAQKMTGALVFDERTDRYDIRFDLASYYGGLHCGDCFDVFTRGRWKPTRIEMSMKQVHETGRFYDADLEELRQSHERLWDAAQKILTSLAKIQ